MIGLLGLCDRGTRPKRVVQLLICSFRTISAINAISIVTTLSTISESSMVSAVSTVGAVSFVSAISAVITSSVVNVGSIVKSTLSAFSGSEKYCMQCQHFQHKYSAQSTWSAYLVGAISIITTFIANNRRIQAIHLLQSMKMITSLSAAANPPTQ